VWIAGNIVPSAARTAALGKYLSSYSKHAKQDHSINPQARTSASRRKLHILYILHDVLHHAKYHTSNLSTFSIFTASMQPFLIELVQSAASERRARVLARIHSLFELWEDGKFYSSDYLDKLRQVATGHLSEQESVEHKNSKLSVHHESNGAAYRMPATHGDPETPYYDLPAGNLLPFLDPGSSAPIRPEEVRALRFNSGPADKPLVNALQDFLKDVESIENRYNGQDSEMGISEIDELGQITIKDEAGDITGDTYYGWSRAFCEKMKRRRNEQGSSDNNQNRSLSRESSRSSSRSPAKKRRYSDDSNRNRSISRSRSPPRFRAASPANVGANREHDRWQPVHASRLPPRIAAAKPTETNKEQGRWQPSQAPPPFAPGYQSGPPPMLHTLPSNPLAFQAPPPFGPNGVPIPPPRPANWNGPWPPPPPPPGGVPFPHPNIRRSNNFPPPLPPPPPPPGYPGSYDYGGSYR
jgi:hypothetical protein